MKKGLIYSNQLTIDNKGITIGYSNGQIAVKEIDRDTANNTIIEHHYSHKVYNGTYINLGIYADNDVSNRGGVFDRNIAIWLRNEPSILRLGCQRHKARRVS